MKTLLIISALFIAIIGKGQKISGTITYFYNDYQGNKADVGASIYVLNANDSSVNFKLIDSVIRGETYYSFLVTYKAMQEQHNMLLKSMLIGKKKREAQALKIPDDIKRNAENYNVDTKEKFDSLDKRATIEILKFTSNKNILKTRADGVGNYSINTKSFGDYYILITSANRTGIGINSVMGKNYLEKINVKSDSEINVSTNFTLH